MGILVWVRLGVFPFVQTKFELKSVACLIVRGSLKTLYLICEQYLIRVLESKNKWIFTFDWNGRASHKQLLIFTSYVWLDFGWNLKTVGTPRQNELWSIVFV